MTLGFSWDRIVLSETGFGSVGVMTAQVGSGATADALVCEIQQIQSHNTSCPAIWSENDNKLIRCTACNLLYLCVISARSVEDYTEVGQERAILPDQQSEQRMHGSLCMAHLLA